MDIRFAQSAGPVKDEPDLLVNLAPIRDDKMDLCGSGTQPPQTSGRLVAERRTFSCVEQRGAMMQLSRGNTGREAVLDADRAM
jgi:hypothetical protein